MSNERRKSNNSQIRTVFYFFRIKTEIEGNGNSTGFQDTKVDGQPFQTVVHEDGHLIPLLHAPGDEHVGKTVGFFVEHVPGDLPAVGLVGGGLDQVIVLVEQSFVVELLQEIPE